METERVFLCLVSRLRVILSVNIDGHRSSWPFQYDVLGRRVASHFAKTKRELQVMVVGRPLVSEELA